MYLASFSCLKCQIVGFMFRYFVLNSNADFCTPSAVARGHYTIGKEIVDLVLDRIRKLADNCTGNPASSSVFHANNLCVRAAKQFRVRFLLMFASQNCKYFRLPDVHLQFSLRTARVLRLQCLWRWHWFWPGLPDVGAFVSGMTAF